MALPEDLSTSPKARVIEMLRRFPDDLTYGDIRYHVYVLEQIEEGLRSIATGPTYTQEEMEAEFRRWFEDEAETVGSRESRERDVDR
jgi:histidyl-tRNA synthetase